MNEPQNDHSDDVVESIVHSYPVSAGNQLPNAVEITRILLPAIRQCWELLPEEAHESNRFTEHMVVATVFATKTFLAQQSGK